MATQRTSQSTQNKPPVKPDTAMAAAFSKASARTPKDRLYELALIEMVAHADDTMKAIDGVWAKVQKDAPMLVALFNPWGEYRSAIGRVFHQLKQDIAAENRTSGGKLTGDKHKAMKIVERERAERKAEEEETHRAEREEQARADRECREYLESWHRRRSGKSSARRKKMDAPDPNLKHTQARTLDECDAQEIET